MTPKWTAKQRQVLANDHVELVGVDAKGRPVVQAMTGIPNRLQTWAVKLDGDPVDVVHPVLDSRTNQVVR